LRLTLTTALFAAALVAAPAVSKAAPRSINDCEAIQAADAYNQCLALFGPVARGHGAITGGEGAATAALTAAKDHPRIAAAGALRSSRRHAEGHGRSRHHIHVARHGNWRGSRAAWHSHAHGKRTAMMFNVVSGRTRLR
jgi:hypothetical protein